MAALIEGAIESRRLPRCCRSGASTNDFLTFVPMLTGRKRLGSGGSGGGAHVRGGCGRGRRQDCRGARFGAGICGSPGCPQSSTGPGQVACCRVLSWNVEALAASLCAALHRMTACPAEFATAQKLRFGFTAQARRIGNRNHLSSRSVKVCISGRMRQTGGCRQRLTSCAQRRQRPTALAR